MSPKLLFQIEKNFKVIGQNIILTFFSAHSPLLINSLRTDSTHSGLSICLLYILQKYFLQYLDSKKIENRPIISGNFLNQPAIKLFDLHKINIKNLFPVAQDIDDRGFFI